MPDQAVAEADPFSLTVTGSDPDLTIPSLTGSGLPTWASFTDNLDGTATITGTPAYTDAGSSLITITADDGSLTDETSFRLSVTNTNRPPIVAPIPDATVAEADPFTLIGHRHRPRPHRPRPDRRRPPRLGQLHRQR